MTGYGPDMLTLALSETTSSQQSDFTPPVIAALALSGLSLLAALSALIWQVVVFKLSAGRVRVRLIMGELVPYAGTYSVRTADHGRRELAPANHPDLSIGGFGMEVGFVFVENPGRLPITVTDVGFSVEYGQQGTYRVSPRSFSIDGHGAWDTAESTYLRLEPFSRAVFCFDFWSIIEERRGRGVSTPIELRGHAGVVGKKKPRLSAKSLRWMIPADAVTSRSDPSRIRAADLILRTIVRQQWTTEGLARPDYYMAEKTALHLHPDATLNEVHEALKTAGRTFWQKGDGASEYVALQIYNELGAMRDRIDWPSQGARTSGQLASE